MPAHKCQDGAHPTDTGQRGWQTEGEFIHPEQRYRYRLQPINQDWLVEAQIAVEVGSDVIAPDQHLARSFAECPFVDIEERDCMQIQKKAQEQGKHERGRQGRAHFHQGAQAAFRIGSNCSFRTCC